MKIILKKRLDINPDAGKIRSLFKKKIDGKVYEGFETSFESKRAADEVADHLRNRGNSVRIIKKLSYWEVFYRRK
jgi:ATP-dependent RNA circularization protein (DNA/RNA ligase family)